MIVKRIPIILCNLLEDFPTEKFLKAQQSLPVVWITLSNTSNHCSFKFCLLANTCHDKLHDVKKKVFMPLPLRARILLQFPSCHSFFTFFVIRRFCARISKGNKCVAQIYSYFYLKRFITHTHKHRNT